MNPDRICWQLGPGGQATVIFFILAGDADAWAYHNFLNETCFPELLEPIKQHLKNYKNTNNSYWTFSI
jgi:hypothetical protein